MQKYDTLSTPSERFHQLSNRLYVYKPVAELMSPLFCGAATHLKKNHSPVGSHAQPDASMICLGFP